MLLIFFSLDRCTRFISLEGVHDLGSHWFKNKDFRDFPGGTVVKNLPANAGDMGSSPGPVRSHMPRSN